MALRKLTSDEWRFCGLSGMMTPDYLMEHLRVGAIPYVVYKVQHHMVLGRVDTWRIRVEHDRSMGFYGTERDANRALSMVMLLSNS